MKVVILAGGLGTRLHEETEYRPKPMVEIGGRPMLWHIMKIYAHYGFTEFIICLGYKGWVIKEYFLNYAMIQSDFTLKIGQKNDIQFHHTARLEDDWQVTLAETGIKSMTGARLKRIEKYIDGDIFMLTYGDGVADINIADLLTFHRQHGKIGTVTGVHPPSRFGELLVSKQSVIKFVEKPQTEEGIISGGFFVFNRAIFDYLDDDERCVFEQQPLQQLALDQQLMVYTHKAFWQCMDNYRDLQYLNRLWEQQQAPWQVW